jgi:hypothetical protein
MVMVVVARARVSQAHSVRPQRTELGRMELRVSGRRANVCQLRSENYAKQATYRAWRQRGRRLLVGLVKLGVKLVSKYVLNMMLSNRAVSIVESISSRWVHTLVEKEIRAV